MIDKIRLRKSVSNIKKLISQAHDDADRLFYIFELRYKQNLIKIADLNPAVQLPTLGKLRLVLENSLKDEENKLANNYYPSYDDRKRWALKSAVYDYYMSLPYSPETIAVDYEGDLTARRDNKEFDRSDVDLAPNKNEIYRLWMEKLQKLVRENKINEVEFDEASERGIPKGGAFEKQLDRYRQDFMNALWQEYYKHYKI